MKQLTTAIGAARMTGISYRTVYRYIEEGLLTVIYREKVMYVNPKEVKKVFSRKKLGRPKGRGK